jgi:protoporphyrinogen/coproporphyrinogen III oxidase
MVTETVDATHDVVVVGGGIAGLATAWHLRDLDVLVLEASDRLGGRIRSEPRGDVWLNFGAHVFGGEGSATGRLLTETRVESARVEGRLAAVALGDRVVASGAVETYPFRLPLPLRSRVALVRAGLRLRLAVRRYGGVAAERPGESAAARQQRMLDFLDDRSFSDFIGPLPADVDAIFRATLNRSSGEPEELAAGYGIGYFHLVWNRDAGLSRNILGGPSRLIEALAAGVDGRIRTGAEVTEVVPNRSGVSIRYLQGGVEHEVHARSAVVATPAFVTREIVRELPADTDAALASVRYGPYVVGAFLTTETRPMAWDDLYALATPGRSFGMLFNTANVLRGEGRQPGGSLMVYAAADAARALQDLDDDEVRTRFLADLASIYPAAAAAVSEVAIQRWERGLPYAAVGRAHLQDALMRPLGPIHLAGDFLGTWYTETACQTAEAAARAVRVQIAGNGGRTADGLLTEARESIDRMTPAEAWDAALAGARVIDIRSDTARARDGIVPGSIHIPRTVLEWRLDQSSPWRNEHFSSLDDELVVICDHGYSSSLVACVLVQLGYRHVADVVGGFEAWLAAGLPVGPAPAPLPPDVLPGSGPPD